jgi:hypothetical protein
MIHHSMRKEESLQPATRESYLLNDLRRSNLATSLQGPDEQGSLEELFSLEADALRRGKELRPGDQWRVGVSQTPHWSNTGGRRETGG